MPLALNSIDRVISNCVLNLVPDKAKAFSEIYRVLKPGGSFLVSDIVTTGKMPADIRRDAELWAGCIAGAMEREEYLSIILLAGFTGVEVIKQKTYGELSSDTYTLVSITVKGIK